MARVKKTAKLVDSLEAVDSSSDVAVSFELGLSRFTLRELDEFMKLS
jgi:anti-sigma-K factor RskA